MSRSHSRVHDQLRYALEECTQSFSFLVSEFGHRLIARELTRDSFRVAFGGDDVGVLVAYAIRDSLSTYVCLLENGGQPESPGEIGPDTWIAKFDLLDIEAESGVVETGEEEVYSIPTRAEFDHVAERLRAVASPLLRGDQSMVPALQNRVRERARQFALIKWGARAKELGW